MKNIVGPKIRKIRTSQKRPITQEELTARVQNLGVTLDRSALSRIEKQERHVTDIELLAISKALRIKVAALFE